MPATRLGSPLLAALVLVLVACGGKPTGARHDAGVDGRPRDAGATDGQTDAGQASDGGADAGGADAAGDAGGDSGTDSGAGDAAPQEDAPHDTASQVDAPHDTAPQQDAPHDTAPQQDAQQDTAPQQDAGTWHVDIYISNTCVVTVVPASITVPAGSSLMLDFHNNSQWYEADVWWWYNGGYTELATGGIWHDPVPACSMTSVHDEYVDISIAGGPTSGCPGFRLWIHCV